MAEQDITVGADTLRQRIEQLRDEWADEHPYTMVYAQNCARRLTAALALPDAAPGEDYCKILGDMVNCVAIVGAALNEPSVAGWTSSDLVAATKRLAAKAALDPHTLTPEDLFYLAHLADKAIAPESHGAPYRRSVAAKCRAHAEARKPTSCRACADGECPTHLGTPSHLGEARKEPR